MSTQSLRAYDKPSERIRQHRQASNRTIIIVEGSSDVDVLSEQLVDSDFFPVGTRSIVFETVRELVGWAVQAVIGIYDRDFDDPTPEPALATHLYAYEGTDLEHMLIQLGALGKMVTLQGSAHKIAAYGGAHALVQRMQECVAPVTRLRKANMDESWGLTFDAVPLHAKIDKATLELNVHGYVSALLAESEATVRMGDVLAAATSAPVAVDGHYRGKDVVAVAGVALRRLAGNLDQRASLEAVLTPQVHGCSSLLLHRSVWLKQLRERINGLP